MNQISDLVESGSTSQDTIYKINILATQLPFEHEGQIPFEHEGSISTTDPTGGQNGITTGPTVEDTAAMEDIITAPPKSAPISVPVPAHISGGGEKVGRNGGGGRGSSPSDAPGTPFAKGGRIDKPLMGRNRYI